MAHIIKCDLVNEAENQYKNKNYENKLHFWEFWGLSNYCYSVASDEIGHMFEPLHSSLRQRFMQSG